MTKLLGIYAERMEALCADLESGEHIQGKGKLHIIEPDGSGKWCCLGRASAVASDGGCPVLRVVTFWLDPETFREFPVERFGKSTETLDPMIQEYFGITEANPLLKIMSYDGVEREVSAASLNDSGYDQPYTLPMIAEAFRRTYLEDSGESPEDSEDTTSAS